MSAEFVLDTPVVRAFVAGWWHAYDPASGEPMPFRFGYVNVACNDQADTASAEQVRR